MKSNRKLLVSSMIMILTCCLLLAGTSFAWFSDSVSSNNNIIKSGNLDVELEFSTNGSDWTTVGEDTELFNNEALWEPGHTEAVLLRVKNAGSLAFKYSLKLQVTQETPSINVNGDKFKLSDYLVVGAKVTSDVEKDAVLTRTAAKEIAIENEIGFATISQGDQLAPGKMSHVQLVVYMPESVGNEANHAKDAAVPTIKFGVDLYATQVTEESDSFGPDYDAAAPWTGGIDVSWYDPAASSYTIKSAEELAGLAAIVNGSAVNPVQTTSTESVSYLEDSFIGKTITLTADLDLRGIEWAPIGNNVYPFKGHFNGNNHTIYNLNVNNEGWAGLFGLAGKGTPSNIANVKVVNATISSCRMAGTIVGQLYGNIDNCHVENAIINVVPNLVSADKYDNGDKVGGIVGWIGDNNNNNNNHSLTNCSVVDTEVSAYRDLGGIAGYAAWSTTIANNSVTNIKVIGDQTINYYADKEPNANAICGRKDTGGTGVFEENNTVNGENEIYTNLLKAGLQCVATPEGELILDKVPASYVGKEVIIPEGVTTIDGYAFSSNQNIEKIVLPSTVTTLNERAFRDTNAKEVILNDGIEAIPYQAFRNASNIESVVIPASVKTINKEAFQNSGIKTLVVPATVDYIEYGGLRDMKELESIVFEGDITLPVFALRACTKLKTVIFKGEVTIDGKGMVITNKENGDGSAISVFVTSKASKDALLAGDTASKDNGGYEIVVINSIANNIEDLYGAINNGEEKILLDADITSDSPVYDNGYGATAFKVTSNGLLDGNGHILTANNAGRTWDSTISITSGTIQNIIVAGAMRGVFISDLLGDVTLNNVEFYDVVYTLNMDQSHNPDAVVTLNNCKLYGWTSYAAGAKVFNLNDCTFGEGCGYQYYKPYCASVLTNCHFEDGMAMEPIGQVTLINCTYGSNNILITADNVQELLGLSDSQLANVKF